MLPSQRQQSAACVVVGSCSVICIYINTETSSLHSYSIIYDGTLLVGLVGARSIQGKGNLPTLSAVSQPPETATLPATLATAAVHKSHDLNGADSTRLSPDKNEHGHWGSLVRYGGSRRVRKQYMRERKKLHRKAW